MPDDCQARRVRDLLLLLGLALTCAGQAATAETPPPVPAQPGSMLRFTFEPADPWRSAWAAWPLDMWRLTDAGELQCHVAREKVTGVAALPNSVLFSGLRIRGRLLSDDQPGEVRVSIAGVDGPTFMLHLNRDVLRVSQDFKAVGSPQPHRLRKEQWFEIGVTLAEDGQLTVQMDQQPKIVVATTLRPWQSLCRLALQAIGLTVAFDRIELQGQPLPLYPRVFEPAKPVEGAIADPQKYLDETAEALLFRPGSMTQEPFQAITPPENSPFEQVWNLVADPGFEHTRPVWVELDSTRHLKVRPDEPVPTGEFARDSAIRRTGAASLRIGNTTGLFTLVGNRGPIDWQRPYRFSAQVRTRNATGRTFLEIQWFGSDGRHIRAGHNTFGNPDILFEGPRDHAMTTVRSEPLAGTADWRELTLDATPPRGAWAAEFRLVSADNSGAVWFDDLRCSVFGAQQVQVVTSTAGYQRHGEKRAVVLAAAPLQDGQFRIRNALTNSVIRQAASLQSLGHFEWLDAHAYAAEFSDLVQDGEYVLHISAANGLEAQSQAFPVRDGLYLSLARLAAFNFYVIRSGAEIPGWHQACFLDDSLVVKRVGGEVVGHKDLVGGWFDAGDYGYFNLRTWPSLYGLAQLQRQASPQWAQYGDAFPDIASEVAWGADYLLKAHRGRGVFFARKLLGRASGWDGPPSLETDQIPGTSDDRPVAEATQSLPFSAAILAASAQAVQSSDSRRSERYLELARTVYEHNVTGWTEADMGSALPLGTPLVIRTHDAEAKPFVVDPAPRQLGHALSRKGWMKTTPYSIELQGQAVWRLDRQENDHAPHLVLFGAEYLTSNANRQPPRLSFSHDGGDWQEVATLLGPIQGDQHYGRIYALAPVGADQEHLYLRLQGGERDNSIVRRIFFLPQPVGAATTLETLVQQAPPILAETGAVPARDVVVQPRIEPWEQLYFLPNVLLADVEMYRATGDQKYARSAEQQVAALVPLIRQKLYLDPLFMGNTRIVKGGRSALRYDFLIAPLLWLREKPDTPQGSAIAGVTRDFIHEFLLPRMDTAVSPFGQFGSYLDPQSWHMGPPYSTEHYAHAAYLLALASNVLDEPAWRAPAERQLHWLLGLNPMGAAYICGTTAPTFAPWTGLHNVPGHEDGIIPGAISKGLQWGRGVLPDRDRHAPRYAAPWGCYQGYVYPGGGFVHGSPAQEIWQWFNGPIILAAVELHYGLAKDRLLTNIAALPLGSTNLLSNSGFEAEPFLLGWKVVGEMSEDRLSEMPQHGRRALRLSSGHGETGLSHEISLRVEAGERYWLSVWARGRGTLHAGLRIGDAGNEAPAMTLDPRLRRYDLQIDPSGSGDAHVVLRLRGPYVVLDNVEVRRLPPKQTAWPDIVRCDATAP